MTEKESQANWEIILEDLLVERNQEMEKSIQSGLIGVFTYNEDRKAFEASEGKIHGN